MLKSHGIEDWNLTNEQGETVAGGVYLFTVENEETGNTKTGKFVVIL